MPQMLTLKQSTILVIAIANTHVFAQAPTESDTNNNTNSNKELEEVLVQGSRKNLYTEITENSQKLVSMPGALGDPLGAIDELPGVITPANGGEPAVRGSSPDDNRYYIDGMPASYIFHQFNTSIFDENILQDFQLYSAGFGAQYSGATGAIFDIRLRDPKNQKFQTTLNASLLRAGIFLESGINENSAFYLSVREGLIQYFLPEDDQPDDDGIRIISAPADSDYQFKYLVDINDQNTLSVTLAGATDFIEVELSDAADFIQSNPDFAGDVRLDTRFDTQGVKWTHTGLKSSELVLNLSHSNDHKILTWGEGYFTKVETDTNNLHAYYRFPTVKSHSFTLGSEQSHREFVYAYDSILFVCTEFDVDCKQNRRDPIQGQDAIDVKETSIYLTDNWQMSTVVNLEIGGQWHTNNYTDENFFHPRLAVSWDISNSSTISSSAGRYNRFPDIETILPLIGNPDLNSPRADHITLGFRQELTNEYSWNIELYHKHLTQLPLGLDEDQVDADLLYTNDVEGQATGFDLLINKNLTDRWYGWLSLSYAKSERTNLRTDRTQNYALDTPIVFNIVGNYQWTRKWNMGFRFNAKSGEATTEIIGIKENPNYPDKYLPVYGGAYEDRLPIYTRLDLRAQRPITIFGKSGSFYIDILNALNRKNTSERTLDYEKVNATGELHTKATADFGIFPSIGFSVTF